jgi:glycosyltransferase involved in cell wall biosynthesis
MRFLTALPVYNEVAHVRAVLDEVRRYSPEVLAVDDGSNDGTSDLLDVMAREIPSGFHVVRHPKNQGYGAALRSAFDFARQNGYEIVVTIDCDGQHQPQRIPGFVAACEGWDIVSGSRYLEELPGNSPAPADRRRINGLLTAELNRRLGLSLTDAFCGFKAYRVSELNKLNISEGGYAMPLQLWVQAAHAKLRIRELPVPRIYLDETRSFGGALDDAWTRLQYYHLVLDRSFAEIGLGPCAGELWTGTLRDLGEPTVEPRPVVATDVCSAPGLEQKCSG